MFLSVCASAGAVVGEKVKISPVHLSMPSARNDITSLQYVIAHYERGRRDACDVRRARNNKKRIN